MPGLSQSEINLGAERRPPTKLGATKRSAGWLARDIGQRSAPTTDAGAPHAIMSGVS